MKCNCHFVHTPRRETYYITWLFFLKECSKFTSLKSNDLKVKLPMLPEISENWNETLLPSIKALKFFF